MTGLPSGLLVEVEFVAGTWTNVTASVDSYSIDAGRTSPGQPAQPAAATVVLENTTWAFTPGRGVLSTGAVNSNYPNVVAGKRLRISWSSGTFVRFLGYVQSWTPTLLNGSAPVCTVVAFDVTARLQLVKLGNSIAQEILDAGAAYYWPLTDAQGASSAHEQLLGADLPLVTAYDSGSFTDPLFGVAGPSNDSGTALKFQPNDASGTDGAAGALLQIKPGQWEGGAQQSSMDPSQGLSYFLVVKPTNNEPSWMTTKGAENILSMALFGASGWRGHRLRILRTSHVVQVDVDDGVSTDYLITGSTPVFGNGWHDILVTITAGSNNVLLYVDGVLQNSGGPGLSGALMWLTLGSGYDRAGVALDLQYSGTVGHFALFPSVLPASRAASMHQAVTAFYGETVDQRIARLLGYGAVDPADQALGSSLVVLDGAPQQGVSVFDAAQAAAASEGPQSVVYVNGAKVRFRTRGFRPKQITPALTIDVAGDSTTDGVQPSLDLQAVTNFQQVTRADEGKTYQTVEVSNAASVAAYGRRDANAVTTYSIDRGEPLRMASALVAAGATPAPRFPRLTVDLLSAQSVTPAQVAAVEIGSRIRATSVPAALSPSPTLDGFAEGWHEVAAVDQLTVAFDLSPADAPPVGVWGDATYGQWQPDCPLKVATQAGIFTPDSGGTGVAALYIEVISHLFLMSVDGLSTSSSAYPVTLQVGDELVTLSGATAVGLYVLACTVTARGVNGTSVSVHAGGTAVSVYQPVTWGL